VRSDRSERAHGTTPLKLDSSKALTCLGWTPKLDLPTALKRTIEWYLKHNEHKDPRELTLHNIQCYEKLLEQQARSGSLGGALANLETKKIQQTEG